ncbi:MAG TPA: hypothetical protein PLD55_04365 [bacterium]|nr:hypothetical protein [bacterium]
MPRLIETKEPRPEHSTVINWTVPVYIKNGEDYYKVCFDIKRKPLSDDSLPLTKEELEEFSKIIGKKVTLVEIVNDAIFISYFVESAGDYGGEEISSIKAILYLAERFELTEK